MIRNLAIYSTLLVSFFAAQDASALFKTKYTGSCQLLAKETGKYPEKKIKGFTSQSLFKKMTTANQLMSEGRKSEARAILNEIKNSTDDAYPLSIVNQYFSRMEYEKGNFSGAVNYAKKVVELDALPPQAILGMKKQVAYAYLGRKDLKSAISWLKKYFDQVIKPPVSDYKTLASLYFQDKQYRNAICPAYIALKKTTKPKEKKQIYKMLFGLHYKLNDLDGSATILAEMINFYPQEKKYWEQLFSIYYQKGDNMAALAVNELAYMKGLWTTEKEVLNLASMHANVGSPYNAAKRIQDGFNKGIIKKSEANMKLLAGYWERARDTDKAISAYKSLSKMSSSGKYSYRAGNMYFQNEQYKEAIKEFQGALNKGGMNGLLTGNTYYQLGAARFYLGEEAAAIAALNKAKNYDKTRKNATSWLAFIKQKQDVRAQMEKDAQEMLDEQNKKEETSSE